MVLREQDRPAPERAGYVYQARLRGLRCLRRLSGWVASPVQNHTSHPCVWSKDGSEVILHLATVVYFHRTMDLFIGMITYDEPRNSTKQTNLRTYFFSHTSIR